jgi:hypothetical protein
MPNHGTTEEARHLSRYQLKTKLEHYHEKLLEHLESADLARETERRHAERAREYTDIIGNLLEVYGSKMRESELHMRQLQHLGRERERPLAQKQKLQQEQEQQKDQQHRKRSRTPKKRAQGRQQSPEGEMFVFMSLGARSVEQALDRGS